MTLKKFAERYRLKVRRDEEDGSSIIRGRWGDIYLFDAQRLAVMVFGAGRPITGKRPPPLTRGSHQRWANRCRVCLEAGMRLIQDGDDEGTLIFDPTNARQAKTAIKVAGARRKKRPSRSQLDALAAANAERRKARLAAAGAPENRRTGRPEGGR